SQILRLFNQRHFGLLAVKIMLVSHNFPFPVDMLKLETEKEQTNAIESMCIFPHSFDKLVPILLQLRFSKYEVVKKLLRQKLYDLILETYHESLYDTLNAQLNGHTDKSLLSYLKKAVTA